MTAPTPAARFEDDRVNWLLFLALGGIWGSSYLFIKLGVETLTPLTLVAARLAFGAALLIGVVANQDGVFATAASVLSRVPGGEQVTGWVLDPDVAPAWAARQGIEDTSLEALAADERVRTEVQTAVDAVNAQVSNVEGIKKFAVLSEDWLPGGVELTPTMKLKRKPIAGKYAGQIEAMYRK